MSGASASRSAAPAWSTTPPRRCGWGVEVADARKVTGLAPLACTTDRIDARVPAEPSRRDLVPAIRPPAFEQRGERGRSRRRTHAGPEHLPRGLMESPGAHSSLAKASVAATVPATTTRSPASTRLSGSA